MLSTFERKVSLKPSLRQPRRHPEQQKHLSYWWCLVAKAMAWLAYTESEWAQSILAALNSGARTMKGFPLVESEVRDRLFVLDDDELRLRLIQQAHDMPVVGHSDRAKTQQLITRNYYWPGIARSIKQFVRNCRPCHRAKSSREKYHGSLKPLPIPERRWAYISIDFVIGLPLSHDYYGRKCINIVVVTDRLAKMVKYTPMDGNTAENNAKAFYLHIWKDHGFPISITTDRGTQFDNHFWDELCQRVEIKANISTAFHPETDGQTENANAVIDGASPETTRRNRELGGNSVRKLAGSIC